tara:strand:+ start:706 stop:972 length:267 start_codon:yes stop_codon:yes gene_type:complete
MKKIIILMFLLTNCTYKPLVDTAGRSGTFDEAKAVELTNDLQHCKTIGKENTNFVSNILYWSVSETMDTKYEALVRKCLSNRGHSVLN